MSRLQAFFLVGPTASGKSAVAQHLAERHGLAVLAADSMTVYRDMQIGTAKPSPNERAGVPHGGLDLASPDRDFSVWEYRREAVRFLTQCAADGRRVAVVGGSGLYVKALTHGLAAAPATPPESRARWEAVFAARGVAGLQAALRALRPEFLAGLADAGNPRRLMRALALAETGAQAFPTTWAAAAGAAPLVGLELPPPALSARIEARVRRMFQTGLVEEARELRRVFPALSRTARHAIGYAEALAVLEGAMSPDAAAARTVVRTRQLAKRQRTWFRHQERVQWIAIDAHAEIPEIAARVWEEWGTHGPTDIAGE